MIIAHVEGSGTADTVKVRRSLNEVAFAEHPRPVLKSPTRRHILKIDGSQPLCLFRREARARERRRHCSGGQSKSA